MNPHGGGSPKQFKVSLGLHVRHKQRGRSRPKNETETTDVRLLRNPRSRAVAPYVPRSELEDSQLRFLIYHYVTVVSERSVTNCGPRFEWYPLAVRDEVFFHAVISSTSSHAAYLQQVDLPPSFFHHRGQAIRLLNERIREGAHDEGTINTIAVFSQQESFEGRAETALTHINGLLQIVEAAGGLDTAELGLHTKRHVYLTDLSASIALMRKPVLVPAVDLTNPLQYFGRMSPDTELYTKTFETRLYNYAGSSPFAAQAATVLWGLRNISQLLDDVHDGSVRLDTPSATDIQFTDRVEVLERMVHALWYVEDDKAPQHAIFRTFGWTCCIYIYETLRELPKELGMNAMLANRVKTALELCPDLSVLLATFQDLLLWQMFICGRVADFRDRPFFAQQATRILIVRKIEDQNGIMAAAKAFIWPERQPKSTGVQSGVGSQGSEESGETSDTTMSGSTP